MNILIMAYGENILFKRKFNKIEIISFLMIILGSVISGKADLSFNIIGYIMMIIFMLSSNAN